MKFSLEHIKVSPNPKEKDIHQKENLEKTLGKEKIEENIQRFCVEVLIKRQELGEGNFSHVYEDTKENGICYKKFKPGAEKRMHISAEMEMDYMCKVHGIDSYVKTPYPLGIAQVVMKNTETGQKTLTKVIAMEHFNNATRMEDVLEPFKKEFKKEFPKSFNPNVFFTKLSNFIEKMHTEKGVYHRDLFARNIMIDNETGNPIVLDFGDAARQPVDETYDPYGRKRILDHNYEDKDLINIERMRLAVEKYLTENK